MTTDTTTDWLVYDRREGKFLKEFNHPTNYVDEAGRFGYDEARKMVTDAAIGEWPDGKPPVVMIPDVESTGTSYVDLIAQTQAASKLIDEAVERMVADRETADWSHPVPIGGLPQVPAAVPPLLPRGLTEWSTACDEAIATLGNATSRAIAALFEAQAALHRLTNGDAWHVKYTDGTVGEDLGAFLFQARRAVMAAGMLHRETAGG